MTEHPRLVNALRLIAAGSVTASVDQELVTRLHGCGVLSAVIWQASDAKLVTITTRNRGRVPVELTDAGRERLASI